MKFTSEIIRTANQFTKSGFSRKVATKLAFKIHSNDVKETRKRLLEGKEFYIKYEKVNGEINKRPAISIAQAIERGLYKPAELTFEERQKYNQRPENQYPERYVKYFDLFQGLPRMAKAENILEPSEI